MDNYNIVKTIQDYVKKYEKENPDKNIPIVKACKDCRISTYKYYQALKTYKQNVIENKIVEKCEASEKILEKQVLEKKNVYILELSENDHTFIQKMSKEYLIDEISVLKILIHDTIKKRNKEGV